MSKVKESELKIRYKRYTDRVKEIMKKEKETENRAISKAALEFNVTPRTIQNAIENRPSRAAKNKMQ